MHAPGRAGIAAWHTAAEVFQALATTPHSEAKRHNIALAAAAFSSRPIQPGGLFSFWGWLGRPTRSRGFHDGRALRSGRLVLETGGGLCQLAGAIYFAGLQAGLTPVERHAHSVDLYTDATRYAPLGSDATVSYGFKDLRLRNPHACAVAFDIASDLSDLRVSVKSESPIAAVTPIFRSQQHGDGVLVETWIDGAMTDRALYKRRPL
jgi:vancomycin resistance protein VanW